MTSPTKFAKEYNLNTGIEQIRRESDMNLDELLAMSSGTDPFWMTPSKVKKAMWAEEVMDSIIIPHIERIGVDDIHLRDIHYILVSIPYQTHRGETYENTMKCWKDLIVAFSVARYLELVDYRLIRDAKNVFERRTRYGKGRTFMQARRRAKNNIEPETVISRLILRPFRSLLNPWSTQKFHVEIWAEKDLALLDKVAYDYGINTVVGEGETSVTMVYDVVDRIMEANKPTRIAYIADCDVVGLNMSKAMARKVEYLLWRRGSGLDVKLVPLMLLPTQVVDYGLPTVPMKRSSGKGYETRKEKFYEAHDIGGATEINALHSMEPQFFEQTLEDFITTYIDVPKWNEFMEYRRQVRHVVREKLDDSLLDLSSLFNMLEEVDWNEANKEFKEEIEKIGVSDIQISDADLSYTWMLDTTLNYGAQMSKYRAYEDGDLL